MKTIFLITSSLLAQLFLSAQQEGRMETDRPDQTESPYITRHTYFQIEAGVAIARDENLSAMLLPTVLWKYGLSKRVELRLVTECHIIETPLLVPQGNDFVTGLAPLQLGAKIALTEEKGLMPQTALIFHLGIPKLASKKFQASKWAPAFVLAMQSTISETVGIGYNLGAEWDGESDQPFYVYTVSPGVNIGKRWYSFLEFFGAVQSGGFAQNSIDGGFGYYINENMKLDASAGFGVTKVAVDHFFGLGFSFRFH